MTTIFINPLTNESFSEMPTNTIFEVRTIDEPILSGREKRRKKRKQTNLKK